MLPKHTTRENQPWKEKSNYSLNCTFTIKKEFMMLQPPQIEREFKIMLITKTSIKQPAIPKKKLLNITIYKEMFTKSPPKKQQNK